MPDDNQIVNLGIYAVESSKIVLSSATFLYLQPVISQGKAAVQQGKKATASSTSAKSTKQEKKKNKDKSEPKAKATNVEIKNITDDLANFAISDLNNNQGLTKEEFKIFFDSLKTNTNTIETTGERDKQFVRVFKASTSSKQTVIFYKSIAKVDADGSPTSCNKDENKGDDRIKNISNRVKTNKVYFEKFKNRFKTDLELDKNGYLIDTSGFYVSATAYTYVFNKTKKGGKSLVIDEINTKLKEVTRGFEEVNKEGIKEKSKIEETTRIIDSIRAIVELLQEGDNFNAIQLFKKIQIANDATLFDYLENLKKTNLDNLNNLTRENILNFDLSQFGEPPINLKLWNISDLSRDRYVNSKEVPYIVFGDTLSKNGCKKGDLCMLINSSNNMTSFAFIADSKPTQMTEISIKAAQELGINPSARSGGLNREELYYFIFPNTKRTRNYISDSDASQDIQANLIKLVKNKAIDNNR
jgi:hypothetical protein